MGIGDNILGTSLAKGARARGKRIAFGDGSRLLWDQNSEPIFRHNPNVVFPGQPLSASDVEWVHYHKGNRHYSTQQGDRWVFNYAFHATPGEFFFQPSEQTTVERLGLPQGFMVVEPNVKRHVRLRGEYLVNKQWPFKRYQEVVTELTSQNRRVVQFIYGDVPRLHGAWLIQTPSFRSAAAILANASLYLGSEGGLHHAAAALGIPAVVLFGGWLPPSVLGYETHINLTGGESEACGLLRPCPHCAAAMNRISVDDVLTAAQEQLRSHADRVQVSSME